MFAKFAAASSFGMFVLLAVSDAVWNSLILAIQTVILAVIAPWVAWKLSLIAKTGERSHDLANSFMLEQKRKHSVMAREKADITHAAADLAVAKEAEDAYLSHKKTDDYMKTQDKALIENRPV